MSPSTESLSRLSSGPRARSRPPSPPPLSSWPTALYRQLRLQGPRCLSRDQRHQPPDGQPGAADGHGRQHQQDLRQRAPALTYTYTGLVNGDKIATFTGSLTTTATASSKVGSYPISQGTLAARGNYTIGRFKAGTSRSPRRR